MRKLRKRQFKQNILDQLDEMRDNDPKKYWNLIRSLENEEDLNHNSIPEDKWHSYFKQLNAIPDNFKEQIDNINQKINALEENSASFSELDFRISEKEISEAIDKLKKNKAAGLDGIPNEIFKGGKTKFLPILHKLFNLVFSTGMYPKQWSTSYITPLFKSGDPKLPENYRGIAINNSLGKLFNLVLNNRLDRYLESNSIINPCQIGFSKNKKNPELQIICLFLRLDR